MIERIAGRSLPRPGSSAPVLLACAILALGCGGPYPDEVLASVNGERITGADLERYRWSELPEGQGDLEDLSPDQRLSARFTLLLELIDQRILLRRAAEMGIVATEQDVQEARERHQIALGGEAELRDLLRERGITEAGLRAELGRRLTVERLVQAEISSGVDVSPAEMRAYYEGHEAAFSVYEEQMHLAQILVGEAAVSPVPNLRNDDAIGREAALEKIRWIRAELADGKDFETLALQYSEDPIYASTGGDMGFISHSAVDETDLALRRVIVALGEGEYSDVVETNGEFRILHLISIEPAGQREFEDEAVQESIRTVLRNRKEQLLRRAFYELERNRSDVRNFLAERIVSARGASE